jgi:hypothetical protein
LRFTGERISQQAIIQREGDFVGYFVELLSNSTFAR